MLRAWVRDPEPRVVQSAESHLELFPYLRTSFGYVSELLKPGSSCSDSPDKEATNVF